MRRKRIPFKALATIMRTVITADPFIDNFDWIESTKRELLRQGWDYPDPQVMATTMQHVERALTKRWGLRPAPLPRQQLPQQPQPQRPDGSPWHIPRDPQPQPAGFAPAIGEQGQLVEALDRYAPAALAAVRRAAQSPDVKARIERARQRTASERAQPQLPSRMVLLQLQRAVMLAQDARAKRRTLEGTADERDTTNRDERKAEHAKTAED